MAYLHVYKDGVQISEGTGSAPLTVGPLNASQNETSAAQEVVIKTETGYTTYGNTTVCFEGTNAAKWSVCATAGGTYSTTLTISTPITNAGISIFIKATSSSDEVPVNDESVDIKIAAVIAVL